MQRSIIYDLNKRLSGSCRKSKVQQGFFDGRFVSRSIPDKRKEASKKACRKWKEGLYF